MDEEAAAAASHARLTTLSLGRRVRVLLSEGGKKRKETGRATCRARPDAKSKLFDAFTCSSPASQRNAEENNGKRHATLPPLLPMYHQGKWQRNTGSGSEQQHEQQHE